VPALKTLIHSIYESIDDRGILEPIEKDWSPARAFFEERIVKKADIEGTGDWHGWSQELDGVSTYLNLSACL
jgi:hypothetical protein